MSARSPALALLCEALFADPIVKAYAVIDGAARPDLQDLLSGVEHACLFAGRLAPEVAAVAPWLAPLDPDGPALATLAAGWGRSEAIFVLSRLDFPPLRRHLRALTRARLPDGRSAYFRFYDPRVLRDIVPVLTPVQQDRMLGEAVEALLCERDEGDKRPGLWRWGRDGA